MERGIEDAVVMDKKTFKSLTSETRAEILKLLKKRNHTLTEISDKLKISKTTAKEHLDVLVEGRLIEQVPSHHKWKYYTLTKDGRKLVGEEGPKRVVITLVALVIGFMLSLYGFTGFLEGVGAKDTVLVAEAPEAFSGGNARTLEAEKAVAPTAMDEGVAEEAYEMDAEIQEEVPEEIPVEEETQITAATEELIQPDYFDLILGIVGIAIIGMALLMLIRSRKQRSLI